MQDWFYARGGRQQGPVDEAELGRLIRDGVVASDDLVWHPGLGDEWVTAASLQARFESGGPDTAALVPGHVPRAKRDGGQGVTHNRDLMQQARASLQGNWGQGALITLVYVAVGYAVLQVPMIGSLASWIISGPLALGYAIVCLSLARRSRAEVAQVFEGFRHFTVALAAYFLMIIFILLWTLLLIIPGIMAAYAYTMTFFVIADEPSISPFEAIRRSKAMMIGMRWKCFCLQCRFIGWILLGMLTFGIGYLWLMPYMQTAMARFYEDVRGRAAAISNRSD